MVLREPRFRIAAAVIAGLACLLLLLAILTCGNDDTEGEEVIVPPTPTGTSVTPTPTPTSEHTDGPAGTPTDGPAPTGPPTLDPTDPPPTDGGGDGPDGGNGDPPPSSDVTLLTPVDKQHALADDYAPSDLVSIPGDYLVPEFGGLLRAEASNALVSMLGDAFGAGYDIRARSAYRSYSEQEATFQHWVDTVGYDEAVRISAMPGHSEHQLGTTADVTSADVGWELTEGFGETAAGQWLAANAHLYGYALSYPAGAEAVTGYAYEPWHFRYIGVAEAAAWKASGLTLNVYLLQ
jgi:D-alanyl-D-alanine carboxypeptidase